MMNGHDAGNFGIFDSLGAPLLCLLFILSLILTSGCVGEVGPTGAVVGGDGLVMVKRDSRSKLWVKPDHHLGRYDNVLVKRIGFGYKKGQKRLAPNDEERIKGMLKGVVATLTQGSPVGIVTEPGPCVVVLNIGLKDLSLRNQEFGGSTSSFVSSFGSATMIIEFVDSESEAVLVRLLSSRDLGGGTTTGRTGVDFRRLGRALSTIVAELNNELQKVVPDTTVRRETECHDGIYKLTGRG